MMLGRVLRGRGKSPAPLSGGKQPQEKQQPGEASEARELARSAGGFVLGLVLASLYGAVVLLAQGHNVWYCLLTTSSLGTALGLGMAFSTKLQVTVLLSLPHIFTREGKMLMLLLALGMAVQGPCSNIVQNFSRAAESLSCGAELTLNQTVERLQRAQEPLLKMLAKIKDISQKAKVVGDHARRVYRSLIDCISYVARALRNVWRWLASMSKVCNKELGSPYNNCIRLFNEAKDKCDRTIPFLSFLCYVIVAFRPLCNLARIILLFCIIPGYIQSFLKRKVSEPIKNTLDRIRREFEFNISAVHRFNVSLSASKSLGQVASDIMQAVRLRLEPTRRLLGLFLHFSFCVILYLYLQAVRYRYRYLRDDTFDNVYITRRFMELDLRCAEEGRATVLPLTKRECCRYISPAGIWLSKQEWQRYGLQLVAVLRHVLLGVSVILADYSLFWLLDLIRHLMQGEVVARAPVVLGISVNGSGYTSKIFKDVVSAFDVLQQGNITVLSDRCLVHPVEPDYGTYINMGLLYGACLFTAIFGSYVARLRRVVCATYYPSREQERMTFLHSTILARRAGLARALYQATKRQAADARQGDLLLYLSSRVPGLAQLARLLGIQQKRCLACKMAQQPDFIKCVTSNCKGLYCSKCYKTLNQVCSICMSPLSCWDTGDEEIDSSDEETVGLWVGALQALRGQERGRLLWQQVRGDSSDEETVGLWVGAVRVLRGQERGRLLWQRVRELAMGRGGGWRLPPELAARLRAQLKEEASGESDGASSGVDSEDSSLSSLDFGYQEKPESSGSELEEVVALQLPSGKGRAR